MSPSRTGSPLISPQGSSRDYHGGRLLITSHGPLAHLTGAIERVPADSGVDLPRAMLYNGALPCIARGLPKARGGGVCRSGSRGSLSPAIPRPLIEGAFSEALSPAWGVSSLETDLVRRPRVRGTAPPATVGIERRRESLRIKRRAFGPSVTITLVIGRSSLLNSSVYLVDPASSHMLVSKIKPCKCQHMPPNG